MPVSRDEVVHAFRLILGRDPGDDPGVEAHMNARDTSELAAALLRSAEFRRSARFKDFLEIKDTRSAAKGLPQHESRSRLQVLLVGNCQVGSLGQLMQAMTGDVLARSIEATQGWVFRVEQGEEDLEPLLADADLVFLQLLGSLDTFIRQRHPAHAHKLRWMPPINYSAFHPDCVYIRRSSGGHLQGPLGDYHSSIAFWAWQQGWTPAEALHLYNADIYELLGFFDFEQTSSKVLLEMGMQAQLPLHRLLDVWNTSGPWMHTTNHPKIRVLADVAAELLTREGIQPMRELASMVPDHMTNLPVWPVYPSIAERLGAAGNYLFKVDQSRTSPLQPHLALSLEDFVSESFKCYSERPAELQCERLQQSAYQQLAKLPRRRAQTISLRDFASKIGGQVKGALARSVDKAESSRHPYRDLPDRNFWRRAVAQTPPSEVDPVNTPRWRIAGTDRIATAGSCFAQHIARTLSANGLNYFVAETGEALDPQQRSERQYGVFSARYGNIYTARQLVQLIDRAYGLFHPEDQAWRRNDGRWVDPFRPQIEPAGFADANEVVSARTIHLAFVRRLFEDMDVFVFTLGLTEAWRRRSDGAVFPLAPGIEGGTFDPEEYEFQNFSVAEVESDLKAAVRRLKAVNPRVRFIFTVSPVPLIATFEHRHVLVSTAESKAILRAAVGQVLADRRIEYFPSFEIVTGPHAAGRYFEQDLRSVTNEGVGHVMRLFLRHYTGAAEDAATPSSATLPSGAEGLLQEQRALAQVVCDEEAIERRRGT
jgi:hypothetical protein